MNPGQSQWGYENRPDLAGRPLSSPVWMHFKRVGTGGGVVAICFYCKIEIESGESRSTGKLRQHIVNKHPEVEFETDDKEAHVKNYYAMMEGSQPPITIKSEAVKNQVQIQNNEVSKAQKIQKPIQEIRNFPTANGSRKDRRLNFDIFEQNIGCAKVSIFQKRSTVKHENLGA